MRVTSPAFEQNQMIPEKYTCVGENVNPALLFEDVPKNAESLTLFFVDKDSPIGDWVHWAVFDIPVTDKVEENSVPGKQGIDDFGVRQYLGPCPMTDIHHYIFNVFALDTVLNMKEGVDRKALKKAMEGHVLASAELVGLYKKDREV